MVCTYCLCNFFINKLNGTLGLVSERLWNFCVSQLKAFLWGGDLASDMLEVEAQNLSYLFSLKSYTSFPPQIFKSPSYCIAWQLVLEPKDPPIHHHLLPYSLLISSFEKKKEKQFIFNNNIIFNSNIISKIIFTYNIISNTTSSILQHQQQ